MSLPKIFKSRWRPLRNVNRISTQGHLEYCPLAVLTMAGQARGTPISTMLRPRFRELPDV